VLSGSRVTDGCSFFFCEFWLVFKFTVMLGPMSPFFCFIVSSVIQKITLIGDGLLLGYRHALNVQIFIKMHRSDYAEKQLKIMHQIDEDHTLTQLANAWLDIAVVSNLTPFTVQCYENTEAPVLLRSLFQTCM
jgi:hypothetical protein